MERNGFSTYFLLVHNKMFTRTGQSLLQKGKNNIIACLKHNISHCPKCMKEKCYKALDKPILEYGSVSEAPPIKPNIRIRQGTSNAGIFTINDYTIMAGSTSEEQRVRIKVTTSFKGINGLINILLNIKLHVFQTDMQLDSQAITLTPYQPLQLIVICIHFSQGL